MKVAEWLPVKLLIGIGKCEEEMVELLDIAYNEFGDR